MADTGKNPRSWSGYLGSGGTNDTIDLAVDGGTPVEFYISHTTRLDINELAISVYDEKSFEAEEFGAQAAISNGLLIYVKDAAGSIRNYIMPLAHPIKQNSDFLEVSTSATVAPFTQTTNAVAVYRINFHEKFGSAVVLNPGEKLIVKVSDDISGVDTINALATGHDMGTLD